MSASASVAGGGERTAAPPSGARVRRGAERGELRRYAEAIAMWNARFDTADISEALRLPEALIARWVANFREQVREQ